MVKKKTEEELEEEEEETEEAEKEEEEEKETKLVKPVKKEPEKELLVVAELPTQQIREIEAEDGKTYTLLTTVEALTELVKSTRQIKKALV